MVYVLILLLLSYSLVVFRFTSAWNAALVKEPPVVHPEAGLPAISVIVAARNEAHVLPRLLNDLRRQDYPSFEVLVVDDHSQDATAALVQACADEDGRFRLLTSNGAGKKQALAAGIAAAHGDVIVTTDADCRVVGTWLSAIAPYFLLARVQMAFGPVRMRTDNTLFSAMQRLEFASLIGAAAATFALGRPAMCNGANLAFRRDAFQRVDGYNDNVHIPSGDDEFLMRKITDRYPQSLAFINAPQAIVTTEPQPSLRDFVHQRLRWAGKWRHNSSWRTQLLAVYILLVQVAFVALPVLAIIGTAPAVMLLVLVWRMTVEAGYLSAIMRFLGVPFQWPAFIALQFVYPFYVVIIGIMSWFIPYQWKGRSEQQASSSATG